MKNVIEILRERGFVEQTTHEQELGDYAEKERITCYIGFDPTASSLHVGSLVPIMALAHMQKNGHRPIPLVGGGTGLVGDPSGRTEMRQLLTMETVNENVEAIKKQLARFMDFGEGKALMLNNADWLTKLEYIPFLRDIGRHFRVNHMIKAESCKIRMECEEGLSFIEFNYMVLQAYDFLELFDRHGCRLQMGGSDQWGNIVQGIDLIRKMRHETAFGVTFPLITTSSGAKMGKTAKGAVWLDANRTSPYEYYQFWINTDDKDVARFIALFTFLPMDEIRDIEKLEGADLNSAKSVLAFETTLLVHGKDEADKAYRAAASMFGTRAVPKPILPSSAIHQLEDRSDEVDIPTSYLEKSQLRTGISAAKLFQIAGLAKSGSDGRRLIKEGGAYMNEKRVESFEYVVTENELDNNGEILLRAGKKRYHKIKFGKP